MKTKKEKISSITQSLKFVTGILSWVVLVLLVIVAGFLLYYFVSVKIYAQKGEKFRPTFSLYTILTESMVPNIVPKDVIVDILVKNPKDIKVGDIITFESTATISKGMIITHRVVDIKEENGNYFFYTQGDANLSPDPVPAPFENVQGKVLFKIPQLGLLQGFLATRGGWLIIVVIPALFVIISDILKIFRLQSAKKEVDSNLTKEIELKRKKDEKKKKIEKNLTERYSISRKPTDPDPIRKKIYQIVGMYQKPKVTVRDLPKKIELPKLKKNPKK